MAEVERLRRVERLIGAARTLSDPNSVPGRALRTQLLETSGLSGAGIELGLSRCLETQPAPQQLARLLAVTPEAPRAHVLLSANVFVAALRAIAVGLASSSDLSVRASRRDPALAEALHALVPELFRLERELAPRPGERVFCYGSDATMAELRASLPPGVWFHAHGSGFGAVLVDPARFTDDDAAAIGLDTALFDQAGCLSPRVVIVQGDAKQASRVAEALATALSELARSLPEGPRDAARRATLRRERDAARYAFELFEAGSGWVSTSPDFVLPPAERCLHVTYAERALSVLEPYAQQLTCIAAPTPDAWSAELTRAFPKARVVRYGDMQRPPLDGPVDRRTASDGERLT